MGTDWSLDEKDRAAARRSEHTDQLKRAAIASFIASSNQLAVLPAAALRIVAMANDPKAGLPQIAAVVRTDPSLATRIIATSNSVMYLGRYATTITSLEKAIPRIGLEGLKGIVLQLSLSARVLKVKGLEREVQALTEHGIYCACAARAIARRLGLDPETGFLIGLLHDVGKIIGLETYMKASPTVKATFALESQGLWPLLNLTHQEVGGFAAQKWALPPVIAESIGHHHFVPERLHSLQFPLLAHVANLVAHQAMPDPSYPPVDLAQAPEVYKLGLDPAGLEKILEQLPEDAKGLLAALT